MKNAFFLSQLKKRKTTKQQNNKKEEEHTNTHTTTTPPPPFLSITLTNDDANELYATAHAAVHAATHATISRATSTHHEPQHDVCGAKAFELQLHVHVQHVRYVRHVRGDDARRVLRYSPARVGARMGQQREKVLHQHCDKDLPMGASNGARRQSHSTVSAAADAHDENDAGTRWEPESSTTGTTILAYPNGSPNKMQLVYPNAR